MQPTVTIDPLSLWQSLLSTSAAIAKEEHALNEILKERLSCHSGYHEALGNLIAQDLSECSSALKNTLELVNEAVSGSSNMISSSIRDLVATQERDPACKNLVEAFLFYRGFKALQAYRVAHYFWSIGRHTLARYLQSLSIQAHSMDIHPAARIAEGIFIDHGTGVVIGETATVEKNVSILHNVTLGGTGKSGGVRHPTIREGVMLGAGCKILGNITVGKNSKVAAGSIVLQDVPENTTAVGIPARIIARDQGEVPAYEMKQEV
jgi:serine O-acetyltransferase